MGGGTIRYSSPQSKNWGGRVPPRIDAPEHEYHILLEIQMMNFKRMLNNAEFDTFDFEFNMNWQTSITQTC